MSDLRNVGGVLIPKVGRGASATLEESIELNANPEQLKYLRRRKAMIEERQKEWERDRSSIHE